MTEETTPKAGYGDLRQEYKALLCLDIDGTVRQGKEDELGRFVNGPEDVVVFPEAVERMREWKDAGGRILGVSNQGGVALGILDNDVVVETMRETQRQTGDLFDSLVWCPHHPNAKLPINARCWCRKPSPGLIIEGVFRLNMSHPGEVYAAAHGCMVGDRDEDKRCAELAGLDFTWAIEWRRGG